MNNAIALSIGIALMSVAVVLLHAWVHRVRPPYVLEAGDLVYYTSEGCVKKATVYDADRVIGVALENGMIQSSGFYTTKILVCGEQR